MGAWSFCLRQEPEVKLERNVDLDFTDLRVTSRKDIIMNCFRLINTEVEE